MLWGDIHKVLVANGYPKTMEDRDTEWKNLRRATINKRDNARITGAEGGEEVKITELDDLVLQVVVPTSPVVIY